MKVYSPPAVLKLLACILAASGAACAEESSNKTHTWDNNPNGVQVFILAGQSNMVGHGKVEEGHGDVKGAIGSLRYQVEHDPKNYGHLVNKDGTWKTRDDVKVWWRDSDITAPRHVIKGDLKPRYGQNGWIGPEYGFGWAVADHIKQPVLIIKTAWGGKSLNVDFRPPSAAKARGGVVGPYYTGILSYTHDVLDNLDTEFPEWKGKGYRIAGFGWHQGWNDRVDKDASANYEANLVDLIKDLRAEFGNPKLPVSITTTGMAPPPEMTTVELAQLAVADPKKHPELKGNVKTTDTRPFWRDASVSPSNFGYHWNHNGESHYLNGKAMGEKMLEMFALPVAAAVQKGEMAGYLLVSSEKVPDEYNAGFSLYAAAWPLLQHYPGHRVQTGLVGTWMSAQYEVKPTFKLYSDIEGGLGWWRDTRFPSATPKFIMGGVAPNFSEIANGPAHGWGTWDKPRGLYGVAQLSPWLLFPMDGLNLKQGTCGELFGYGYLPLPLTAPKATTGGKHVPTGDNCWTLFLNTRNFKGPVAFFTPYFWSHAAELNPAYAGLLLDSRPSAPNKPFQMETQYIPAALAVDDKTGTFARIAPTSFPVGPDGNSIVLHRLTSYKKSALWDGVKAWFNGGAPVSSINPAGAYVQTFHPNGGSTWKIYEEQAPPEKQITMNWKSFATPIAPDPTTYGYRWDAELTTKVVAPNGDRVLLPEYFRLQTDGKRDQWVVAKPAEVPAASGLAGLKFDRPQETPQPPYDTPEAHSSSFKQPGPVAGPFQARLGDGSVVTYYWYRFADQPALLNADLTPAEREAMQARVEKLHRAWTKDRDYLAPPTVGQLADLDPAQIVTPPKGFEIGYVPIATRQELER